MSIFFQVEFRDIVPGPNNSIDLTVRLPLLSLLKSIDASVFRDGEATLNPIPNDPPFFLANENFCTKSANLKYIVYVHSAPSNFERRLHLRRHWANPYLFLDGRLKTVYLMGKADNDNTQKHVMEESARFGDIVIGDFADHYENLTIKGIFGLKWLSLHCKQVQYVIKADDDAFVNIFKLMDLMDEYASHRRVVMCGLWTVMPILRDSRTCKKWCVKYSEFPGRQFFPKYCAGVTYTLSRDIVDDMYSFASKTPFFWIDDVYVTGLLLGKTKNVEYVSLLKKISLREKKTLDQYMNASVPYSDLHYFTHVRKPPTMTTLFQQALRRQGIGNLEKLNKTAIAPFFVRSLTLPKNSSRLAWKVKRPSFDP